MGLDFSLEKQMVVDIFHCNITHNLGKMAYEAGVYNVIWRPEEVGIETAGQMVQPLSDAIRLMESEPERFRKLEPPNKWGTYDGFLPWLRRLRDACREYPDSKPRADR